LVVYALYRNKNNYGKIDYDRTTNRTLIIQKEHIEIDRRVVPIVNILLLQAWLTSMMSLQKMDD